MGCWKEEEQRDGRKEGERKAGRDGGGREGTPGSRFYSDLLDTLADSFS